LRAAEEAEGRVVKRTNGKASANGHTSAPSVKLRRERKPDQLGPIDSGSIYPSAVFRRLTGMEARSFRLARRAGLRAKRIGRRLFISGKDFADFVEALPEDK
jgi:hypothetical protein